jgi:hypothetical protein
MAKPLYRNVLRRLLITDPIAFSLPFRPHSSRLYFLPAKCSILDMVVKNSYTLVGILYTFFEIYNCAPFKLFNKIK